MASSQELVEQRKHKRFVVRQGAFVILKPSDIGAGRLLNISMDGLTFDCFASLSLPIEATEVDIFLTDSPFRVSDLPCRTIWDLTIYERRQISLYKRRYGVQFGKLTPHQISQLEYFIQNHTTGEA